MVEYVVNVVLRGCDRVMNCAEGVSGIDFMGVLVYLVGELGFFGFCCIFDNDCACLVRGVYGLQGFLEMGSFCLLFY